MEFPKKQKEISKIIVAVYFISTSLLKIFSFPQFIAAVQSFDILPSIVVLPFSVLLVVTELIAGIGLLIQWSTKMCGIVLNVLLAMFTFAIIANLVRGNIVDCGCFGNTYSSEISWWSVIRNFMLGLILYWLFLKNESSYKVLEKP